MNILTYKYDSEKEEYTSEIEQIPLKEFVARFCNRREKVIVKLEHLLKYAEKRKIPVKKNAKKSEITAQLLDDMSDDEILDFCDDLGIGVRKQSYLAAGMSESEYRQVSKSLTVVRKERASGGRIRRLYSIREYLAYVSAREDKPWLTMKDILKQQNPSPSLKKRTDF